MSQGQIRVKKGVSFHAFDSDEQRYRAYEPGDRVPLDTARLVSRDHLTGDLSLLDVEVDPNEEITLTRGDLDARVAELAGDRLAPEQVEALVEQAKADARAEVQAEAQEAALAEGAPVALFDPRKHNAQPVYDYLQALPDTVLGESEYLRVVSIEQDTDNGGENRKTAIGEPREFEYADEADPADDADDKS